MKPDIGKQNDLPISTPNDFFQLINIDLLEDLIEKFNTATSIPIGLGTPQGEIIISAGWQKLCTDFHHKIKESKNNCLLQKPCSEKHLSSRKEITFTKCKHGLNEITLPIIINKKHYATLFLGQFLFDNEPVGLESFKAQAKKYNFDEKKYLYALSDIPRLSPENVDKVVELYKIFVKFISKLGETNIKLMARKNSLRKRNIELAISNQDLKIQNDEIQELNNILENKLKEIEQINKDFKQSKLKYRLLFETMHDAFALYEIIYDKNGNPIDYLFLEVNPSFEKLTRLSLRRIRNKKVSKVLPGIEQYWFKPFKKVVENKESLSFENFSPTLNKYISATVFIPQEGQIAVVYQDISKRKKAELQLLNYNRTLDLLQKANEFLIYINNEMELIEEICNLIVEAGYCMSWIAYMGKKELDFVPFCKTRTLSNKELDDGCVFPDYRMFQSNAQKSVETQQTILQKETQPKPFVVIYLPLQKRNEVFGTLCICSKHLLEIDDKEISLFEQLAQNLSYAILRIRAEQERKLMEQNLAESENKFRTYVETAPNGIFIFDEKRNFIFINPAACDILGYSHKELINKNLEMFSFDNNKDFSRKLNILKEKGKHNFEAKLKNKNNSSVNVLLNTVKISENNYMAYCTDISKRIEHEEQLKKAKEKAEEADNMKTAFLTNMSHEIRTPMNGILGFAELLKNNKLPKKKQEHFLNIICDRGKHLLTLINDIIDLAKIEAGKIQVVKKECSLNAIMTELYVFFQSNLSRKSKKVEIKVKKELKDSESKIISDPIRLQQILTNLIGNAVKFTNEGYIEFGYSLKNDFLNFYVKDTGIGMSKEQQKLIFERFRQADDSITRKFGGTGLGLTISKALVEQLGGKIWVDSDENGSVFSFTIPYEISTLKKGQYENLMVPLNFNWENKIVLIAEDDLVSFMFLEETLQPTKIKIIRAEDGNEAVEKAKNKKIDIVLMDLQLPNKSGYIATEEIVKLKSELPIIAQTANVLSEDKQKAMVAGCKEYITKPINPNILLLLMSKYLK